MILEFTTYHDAAKYLGQRLVADQRAGWCVNRTADTAVTIGEIEGSAEEHGDPNLMFRVTRRLGRDIFGHWIVRESRI